MIFNYSMFLTIRELAHILEIVKLCSMIKRRHKEKILVNVGRVLVNITELEIVTGDNPHESKFLPIFFCLFKKRAPDKNIIKA